MAATSKRVLHVITRLDRGGSAENTLLTVVGTQSEIWTNTLAFGLTQGPRSETESRARQKGVKLVEIPSLVRPVRPVKDLFALYSLWRLMRRGSFHIVHTHTSKGGLLGRLAALLARVPIVVHTPHGHVFYGYYGSLVSWFFARLEGCLAHVTDRLVALTRWDAEDHIRFGVGTPNQFVVIHSGVDFSSLDGSVDRRKLHSELGIDADGLVVGTVGRLTAVKGQGDLLTAFARILPKVPNAWLVLFGDGEESNRLIELATQLAVKQRVLFPGWWTDLRAAYGAIDVFAFPSHNEGMGKALVEAMYCSLPSVVTRVGGVPELVEEGVEGLLVPPGDPDSLAEALVEIASDGNMRLSMGNAARERAVRYGVEPMVESIESMYTSLLELKTESVGPR